MAKRLMVAAVGLPLIFCVFYVFPPVTLLIMISLLSVVGIYESLRATGMVKHPRILFYSAVLAGLIPVAVYLGAGKETFLFGLFLYLFVVFCEALASKYAVKIEQVAVAFFFSVLIPYALSAFLRIRFGNGDLGIYYLLIPIAIPFASDTSAFFGGMFFGKHKLAPSLSPKKTVEGFMGGIIGTVFFCVVYGLVLQLAFEQRVSYSALVVYGVFGSVVSSIGDLVFSYIKRQFELKDFGRIFPGHGGVLDRFDSVIFCAPFIELLIWLAPALK